MKHALTLIATFLLLISTVGIAAAEMVTIGPMAIERADYNAIRDRMAGIEAKNPQGPSQSPQADIGLMEIEVADLADLQDYVAGRKSLTLHGTDALQNTQVNVGLLEIEQADLQKIEKLTGWMKTTRPGKLLLEKMHAGGK